MATTRLCDARILKERLFEKACQTGQFFEYISSISWFIRQELVVAVILCSYK